MILLRVLLAAAGASAVIGTSSSLIRTLIVPRGLTSRLTRLVSATVRRGFLLVADRYERYEAKDALLAPLGPISLTVTLATWLGCYLLGFWLLQMALSGQGPGASFRETGSSMFTLGFASTPSAGAMLVDFAAAATGPIVVALQISYLPTLYSAYNRRETEVTLLQSRAGEPAWGPEILARHQLVGILDSLRDFYAAWERWAADVAESHTNYPILVDFRSPKALRSWVVALLAVLDSAALYNAAFPAESPSEARLCLRMGFLCLRDVAGTLGIAYDPDPRPDAEIQLTYDEFLGAYHRLEEVGFTMERTAEQAWPHFRGWRVNYESLAYELAYRVDAVPALWSGPRRRLKAVMAPNRPPDRKPESPDVTHPPSYGRYLDR
ncbi:MAG: hypothetical protein M3Z02_01080 [Actinomycetota bacterium]|nr:hypothetical protein [Actinomycetota bacterium]